MTALSGLPASQWQTLPVLELIYQRNKPAEAPKEAPLAPFFLPTVATASTLAFVAPSTTVTAGDVAAAAAASTTTHLPAWSDDSEEEDGGEEEGGAGAGTPGTGSRVKVQGPLSAGSRLLRGKVFSTPTSTLGKLLWEARGALDSTYDAVFDHLLSLPPTKVDVEIRSITAGVTSASVRQELLATALQYFETQLATGRAFEVVEAQLGLFLRVWADDIVGDASGTLKARCASLLEAHRGVWASVHTLLLHNLCLVNHFSSIQ